MSELDKSIDQRLAEERDRMHRYFTNNTVALIAAMRERFGDEVLDVVTKHAGEATKQAWAARAAKHGSNSIEDLIKLLWEPMQASGQGFEYSREEREGGVQMTCTKCFIHAQAIELGQPEIVHAMNCATDPYIVEGFNPNIGFRRTKTLVEGHDCCNHFYFMKK